MTQSPAKLGTLSDVRFGVVDVETSGLSTSRHRVLQVAIVTVNGDGTVLDTWVSLIRPHNRWLFRLGPRHIHGLTRSALPEQHAVKYDNKLSLRRQLPAERGGLVVAYALARSPVGTHDMMPTMASRR